MENTSCGQNCCFVKCGICPDEKGCPNYQESWWIADGKDQPVLIKDCAPKRIMIQQQFMQIRMEAMQKALEESRNEYNHLATYFKQALVSCQVIAENQIQQIEKKNEKIFIANDDYSML